MKENVERMFPVLMLLLTGLSCHPVPLAASADDEAAQETPLSDLEVVVASIDPALPRPGPEFRGAQTELARSADRPLKGYIAIALTGDEAAPETLIRALGEDGRCNAAARALAFLPRKLAQRPLWLALRLECSSTIARAASEMLGFDALVQAAQESDELPDISFTVPPEEDVCPGAVALESFSGESEAPLPQALAHLEEAGWALPNSVDELCTEPVLAAALRLKRGEDAVRLALDLALDSPGEVPAHLMSFISLYGLGGTTPRLASRADENNGSICDALVRADLIESVLPLLTERPEELPLCLLSAARALVRRNDEASLTALDAIAHTGMQPDCGAGALVASVALVEKGEHPPRWTSDPVFLGRALAAILEDGTTSDPSRLTTILSDLQRNVERLMRPDDQPPPDGPVRLYQRDIRAVLPSSSGSRRAALEQLLAEGTR